MRLFAKFVGALLALSVALAPLVGPTGASAWTATGQAAMSDCPGMAAPCDMPMPNADMDCDLAVCCAVAPGGLAVLPAAVSLTRTDVLSTGRARPSIPLAARAPTPPFRPPQA